jgi:thiamine-monophosphate kinase
MAGVPLPEKKLIERIRRLSGRTMPGVLLGIGDDAAILEPPRGHELLVTIDFSLEGTHFRREWHPPEAVGQRCLARGLSDIGAMGGEPIAAFLSLALPKRLHQSWVDRFLRGFLALARRHDVSLAGGDISQAEQILADVMVVGSTPKGTAVRRSGAKPGDVIYVTGSLGGAAAGLAYVSHGAFHVARSQPVQRTKSRRDVILSAAKDPYSSATAAGNKHLYPEPRLAVGRWLREHKLATAMIDISDGLSTDLAHICKESGVGAVVNQPLLPIAAGATLAQALHGGEDYELLFTARPKARVPVEIAGVPITEIGWITREHRVLVTDLRNKPTRLRSKGWQYF